MYSSIKSGYATLREQPALVAGVGVVLGLLLILLILLIHGRRRRRAA